MFDHSYNLYYPRPCLWEQAAYESGSGKVTKRIFLYEFVTGGGWYLTGDSPRDSSLLAEGLAMSQAIIEDLAKVNDSVVSTMWDARLESPDLSTGMFTVVDSAAAHDAVFLELSSSADWTIIIAPELSGYLIRQVRAVGSAGGRLLGPSAATIELASDKNQTALHLAKSGIPVPRGMPLPARNPLPSQFRYPAIWKPADGAGSVGVTLVAETASWSPPTGVEGRLEEFHQGIPASVAFLCGQQEIIALPACRQKIANDGSFRYTGGELPLPKAFAQRATSLARRAIDSLPGVLGYIGVDVILDSGTLPHDDVIIDINPRLTTSYVGLRSACDGNLAESMIRLAKGEAVELGFNSKRLAFACDGRVAYANESTDTVLVEMES